MTGYCGQELWFALKGIDKIYEVLESCSRISSFNNSPIVFYDLSDTGYISDLDASRLLVISASGLLNDKKCCYHKLQLFWVISNVLAIVKTNIN